MSIKMNDFLLAYYKQLIFNNMPAEIRAQFDAYAKNDDFRGNMGDWKKNHLDKDLPNPNETGGEFELEDAEWDKLFNAFQDTFRSMDANRSSFKENKNANDFLEEYYGSGKLFQLSNANNNAEQQITLLIDLLNKHSRTMSIKLKDWNLIDSDFSFNDLIDGLKSKKYNSDSKFQSKLKDISKYISYYSEHDSEFGKEIGKNDFTDIEDGFNSSASIDLHRINFFKNNYNSLLKKLYTDKKVYDVFKENDSGKISKQIDSAIGKTDYLNKESKDFIPPKREDELNVGQQLSKFFGETYEDCLEKYVTLRGDRLFFSPEAKFITKAIDGAKIKPTDGLAKVIAEADTIKKNLLYKSPKASEAFEYFIKIMEELKVTMKDAFNGALSHGHQMRALIEEMSMSAVRNGKVKEAKIAMEVLSVIKYGYTTSRIMDAVKKENLTIFSDPGLSWNKHESMKFISTAFDKSLKTALIGTGYGITMIGNAVRLSGSKFNNKSKRMDKARNEWLQNNQSGKNNAQTELNNLGQRKTGLETTLQNLNNQHGINEQAAANFDNRSRQTNLLKENIELLYEIEKYTNWINDPANANDPYFAEMQKDLQELQTNLANKIQDAQTKITNLQTWMNDPANANNPDMQKNQKELTDAQGDLLLLQKNLQDSLNMLPYFERFINNTKPHVDSFRDATNELKFLGSQITKRETEINEWDDKNKDQYLELMAHWDFLETGSNVKSFALGSKKAKQKYLDENISADKSKTLYRRDSILSEYYKDYQYAS